MKNRSYLGIILTGGLEEDITPFYTKYVAPTVLCYYSHADIALICFCWQGYMDVSPCFASIR